MIVLQLDLELNGMNLDDGLEDFFFSHYICIRFSYLWMIFIVMNIH